MPISSKDAVKRLERAGYVQVRQTASHLILRHPSGKCISVPMGRKDMRIGTLKQIERDSGVKLT